MSTKIEWTDETINPIQDVIKGKSGRGYHCTKISPACDHCYAERGNKIRGNGLPLDGRKAEFEIVASMLGKPLRWKKSKRIFVYSMGDLFHEDTPAEMIAAVFGVIAFCQQHTFQILTKRPDRMLEFFTRFHDGDYERNFRWWHNEACSKLPKEATRGIRLRPEPKIFPLPNLWLGVTVENQRHDDRILILKDIPAAVRFISLEPLIGPFDFLPPWLRFIDWVIVGGETGPGARPMNPEWVRSVRDQCMPTASFPGIPFFFKSWGTAHYAKLRGCNLDGREWKEFPK